MTPIEMLKAKAKEMGTAGYLLMLGLCRWKLERDAREIEERFYP